MVSAKVNLLAYVTVLSLTKCLPIPLIIVHLSYPFHSGKATIMVYELCAFASSIVVEAILKKP